jgi:hypothetical protein
MLKSLERIEKKLEKERDSSTTESHRTHRRRGRSRSGSRHLSLSQRHSDSKTHSSSSPSPTRKHRKSGREELKGEMNKIKPPTFDGEHKKEEDAETWLLGMKKYFQLQNYSAHAEGRIAMYQLKGKSLPFERLGMTRRGLRKNRGRRETSLPFSETVVRNSHHLESREGSKRVHKDKD